MPDDRMPERTPTEEAAIARSIWEAMDLALIGRPADAIKRLSADPAVLSHHAGLNRLGSLYFQVGLTHNALQAFDAALGLSPTSAQAHCNRGAALQRLGRIHEALAAYDAALENEPSDVMANFNRGNVLNLLSRSSEAIAAYDRALQMDPTLTAAQVNRGLVKLQLGDFTGALPDFEQALLADTNEAAQQGRLAALRGLMQKPRPLPRRSARAAPPPGAENLISRANVLVAMQRYEQALGVIARIQIRRGPIGAAALTVRSTALWKSGRKTEALAAGREAVSLDPSDAKSREIFGLLCLKAGDFQRGWEEHEYRLAGPHARLRTAMQTAPAWSGESLAGNRIVVLAEQGLGDTLQFIRYLKLLHEQGAEIAAVVQRPLLPLLRSMHLPVDWTDTPRADVRYDYHAHLMSLPRLFATRIDTIPWTQPYLAASGELVGKWRERIGSAGLRVGVAWQGNPAFSEDHLRSVPLADYAPLALPGVRLISLQALRGLGQLCRLPEGMVVEDLGDEIGKNPDGLVEIAAAMASLDLVVTSDTAVAHLAGALGRPVWVALSSDPDWRWLTERRDSPWYPTMQLFRQKTPGDWSGVFQEIRGQLAGKLEQ